MDKAIRMIGFIFAVAAVVMIFAAVFAPGRESLARKGLSPSGMAAIYAVIFAVASIVCYLIAEYGSL